MHILFDLWSVQPVTSRLLQGTPSKFNGGSEYAKVVFSKLLELRKEEEISAFYNPDKDISLDIKELVEKNGVKLFPARSKSDLQNLIKSGKFDRFYSALPYNYYDIDFSNVEVIFAIHGLRPIEMPTDKYELKYDRSLKNILKFTFKRVFRKKYIEIRRKQFLNLINTKSKSKFIIVPSYHTKYSLISNFPKLNTEQVKMLYAPLKSYNDFIFEEESSFLKKMDIKSKNYFLIVSGDRWIKNSYRALKAFDEIFFEFPEIEKKVLILGISNSTHLRKYLIHKDKFVFYPYVEEIELQILYKNAFLFVYPTLNEGFGYPPLEAMKYGTPVICSAISAVTEVCGDGVVYFNPFSIEEMKNRILFMTFEKNEYKKYSILGKKRYEFIFKKQEDMLIQLCKMIIDSSDT